MQGKMIGLFKTSKGPGNMELREVQIPKLEENEVLIEVKAAGICGTDIHIKNDKFPYWPPVIMGHEFSGIIVEKGEKVTEYNNGDRVVGEPHTKACGKCYLCRTGNIQICSEKRSPGWGIDGAFARYLKMPEHLLHRIPDSMTFKEGAVVEPAANVVQDVLERGKVEPEDFVVVNGPGAIGLMAAMAAKAGGAKEVLLIGTPADESIRLPIARKIGVDHIVVAGKEDPVEIVMELTNGRGADYVVEASGSAKAIYASVKMLHKMGRISVIGMTGKDNILFPWDEAIHKVCTIIFNLSTGYTCWDRAISMIASKKIDVNKIITHVEPLKNWKKVFYEIESMKGLKAILIP